MADVISMKVGNDWDEFLEREFNSDYFKELEEVIEDAYKRTTVYPAKEDIFNAFKYTPLSKVKVVILGQDPYHEEGQAHGLAFSTPRGNPIPKSLHNIFKEIQNEYGYEKPKHGYLIEWARQGVLLLNTVLTVRKGSANSHANLGWETFTDNTIKELNRQSQPIVFLLWGKKAENKKEMITNKEHLVLVAAHPSPLSASRGFFGCNHFKMANDYLKEKGTAEIEWKIQ